MWKILEYGGHIQEEKKAIFFVYIKGLPYCAAEESSNLISCLHDAIFNAVPIIGGDIDKK